MSVRENHRFLEVRKVFNQHDTESLIAIGCPEDEYDIEVRAVIGHWERGMTERETRKLLEDVFLTNFTIDSISKITNEFVSDLHRVLTSPHSSLYEKET
jgi:hypothetical protein